MYTQFRANVLGRVIGDGQCVSLVVNNSQAYVESLFPGVSWTSIIAPVPSAKLLAGKSNQYLEWIANDHNNASQVPQQGDIMVFDATPQAGYTNTFNNPDGHTGICDSANSSGYTLLQQNSPSSGSPANLKTYPWKFRPCLGWYRPLLQGNQVAPGPSPTPPAPTTVHTIHLPQTTGPWHLYNVGGPYNPAQAKAILVPSQYPGGITEKILNNRGNGVYTVQTQMYGIGDLWTSGSDVQIS
jgi:hypothetical protein